MRPRLDPSVRLAWILIIEVVPLLGILGYLLFGEIRIRRTDLQNRRDVRDRLTGRWRASPADLDHVAGPPEPVVAANRAVGGLPAVGGNEIHLLAEDDGAIDALVEAIERARDHVHLLFYIWLPDRSGQRVAQAVMDAARRGVAVRVIVDAFGSRPLLRSPWWEEMREAGVDCRKALPLAYPLFTALFQRLDLRNHRKAAVIDGCVAFAGSRNCADMEFAVKPRFAPWIDVLARVEGPAVRQVQAAFLADWMSYTGHDLGHMLDMDPPPKPDGSIVQVVATGPDRRQGSMSDCMAAMIHGARRRLVVTTPYYVPDPALDAAIRSAARRGVEVVMILPERNDSLMVAAVSEGFWWGLASAGVKLRLFRGGLLHSKIITVDGQMAMLGSANLDRRSFELNYELNLLVVDAEFTAELDERQRSYVARSRPITLEQIRRWPWWRRLRNNVLSLAAPLL